MHGNSQNRERPSLNHLAIVLIPIVLFLPFILVGVPGGHPDQDHHLRIIRTFEQSFQNGSILPKFAPDENLGFGSYYVRVYPPLFHFVSASLSLAAGDWSITLLVTFVFFSSVGMFGMYKLAEEFGYSAKACLAAAVTFAFTPYWLNHAYNSFFYAEFATISIIPWCLVFTHRLCRVSDVQSVAGLGISIAALVISNLPQAAIGAIAIAVFFLLHVDRHHFTKQLLAVGASLLTASCLAAFYLARLLSEAAWFKIAQANADPAYDYRNHFVLSFSSPELSGDSGWFAAVMLGLSLAIVTIGAVASGNLRRFFGTREVLAMLAILGLAVFLMLPVSAPLWEASEMLRRVQFPWRFLSVIGICSGILLAKCFVIVGSAEPATRRPRLFVLTGLVAIAATFSVKQIVLAAEYVPPEQFESRMATIGKSVGLEHWQPVWVDRSLFKQPGQTETEGETVQIERLSSDHLTIKTDDRSPAGIELLLSYYPLWSASVDGLPVDVFAGRGGTLTVQPTRENSTIDLRFVEPAYLSVANWLSAASFATVILLVLLSLLGLMPRNNITHELHS